MTLSTTLKALITKHEISESELARQTGIAQPIIHRILNSQNTNPKLETLKSIADYFMITISQLIGEIPLNAKNDFLKTSDQVFCAVPLITWEQASLWPKDHEIQRKNTIKILTNFQISSLAYCLQVKCSSMEPVFPNNSLLIIEPNNTPKNKDFVVIKLNTYHEVVIKQFILDGGNSYLQSLNPDLNFKNNSILPFKKENTYKGTVVQSITNY